jgi:hypothetical protein
MSGATRLALVVQGDVQIAGKAYDADERVMEPIVAVRKCWRFIGSASFGPFAPRCANKFTFRLCPGRREYRLKNLRPSPKRWATRDHQLE